MPYTPSMSEDPNPAGRSGQAEAENSAAGPSSVGGLGKTGRNAGATGTQIPSIPNDCQDDVVATQIREAAENETDPEMKEKLMDEYINYKQSSCG